MPSNLLQVSVIIHYKFDINPFIKSMRADCSLSTINRDILFISNSASYDPTSLFIFKKDNTHAHSLN